MLKVCRHAFRMGYLGTGAIHPGRIKAADEGFTPPREQVDPARKVKVAREQAYGRGEGSVSVDGRMVDVANMKHINYISARAAAIENRKAEKAAAIRTAGETD